MPQRIKSITTLLLVGIGVVALFTLGLLDGRVAMAQTPDEVSISPGVTLVAEPGDSPEFIHTVTFESDSLGSATLGFTATTTLDTFVDLTVIPLSHTFQSGEDFDVRIIAEIDADALPDTAAAIDVRVFPDGNPSQTLASASNTLLIEDYDVEVGEDQEGSAEPGDTETYTVRVTNRGTIADTYILSAASNNNFVVSVSPTSVNLNPNAFANISVNVVIPDSTSEDEDITTFRARSAADPNTTDTATLTTSIEAEGPPIDDNLYADQYEPNNNIDVATELIAGAASSCQFTLWPVGDVDYITFYAKAGSTYRISTENLSLGLDTFLTLYDRYGNALHSNDDYLQTNRASRLSYTITDDGYYFASVINLDATDPTDLTYCIRVEEIIPSPTPTPELLTTDAFEPNGSFETAPLIETGVAYSLNFVPPIPPGPDNDFFRIWVKPQVLYTCETSNLSGVNDTNMILYDQNRNVIAGNDDKAPGEFGSRVSYYSTYTGWLYILVGPYNIPEYEQSPQFTYSLACTSIAATPTATPTTTATPTRVGSSGSSGSGFFPTPTPRLTPTPEQTPTPFAFATPSVLTPTPQPTVQFVPLPTATPASGGGGAAEYNVEVTIYYDENFSFTPELDEGIMDVGVAAYAGTGGQLLAFGYTNSAGTVRFGPLAVDGPIRIVIPFFGFSQTVSDDLTSVVLRIAPQTLPGQIP